MLRHLQIDDNNFSIENENNLIDIFDALVSRGIEPFTAYNLISERYGEEIISEFLGNENLNLEI